MVEKVEGEIAKVMKALRPSGLEDNTLVILASDHGDWAGAQRFNQKTVFYEESVRIPLIVRWKGKTAGATCDKLVNTGIDILPTMFDAAGIAQPMRLPGSSLLPLPLGPAVPGWRDHLVAENHLGHTGEVAGITPKMEGRMVRSERYKYCVYQFGHSRESLYDLQKDPLETVNLSADSKDRQLLLQHRDLLRKFGTAHNDPLVEELLANDVGPRPFAK